MALGNASSCVKDEFALFNNVAGLGEVKTFSASCAYQAFPSFRSFDRMSASVTIPFSFATSAIGVYRFGSSLYNEQIVSIGFANQFGIASLGVKVNYIQYYAEGFGSRQVLTASFGGIAQLTKVISVGAHITNINQPKISETTGERVPTFLAVAIGFKMSDKVFVSPEMEKDLDHDVVFKTGLEYNIFRKAYLRLGFNLNPQALFAGFGFNLKKLSVNYALSYDDKISLSHQASISWKFKTIQTKK